MENRSLIYSGQLEEDVPLITDIASSEERYLNLKSNLLF